MKATKIVLAGILALLSAPSMAQGPIKKLLEKEFPITVQGQWRGMKKGSDQIEVIIRDWQTGALLNKVLLSPSQPSRSIQLKKFDKYALEARTLSGSIVTPLYSLRVPIISRGGTVTALHWTGVLGKSTLTLSGRFGQVRVLRSLLKPAWYRNR